MEKLWRFRYHEFRGQAGIIRRRILVGVLITLVFVSLALLDIQFLLSYSSNPDRAFPFGTLLAVVGVFSGYFIALRLTREPLQTVERVEKSIREYAESDDLIVPSPSIRDAPTHSPLAQAHYSLVNKIEENRAAYFDLLEKSSHPLLTSMTTIIGYGEMLADTHLRQSPQFLDKCSEVVVSQGKRVAAFLDEIMVAAAVENERCEKTHCSIRLSSFIQHEVCHGDCPRFVFINQADDAQIHGDPVRLREALFYLLSGLYKKNNPESAVYLVLKYAETPGWIDIFIHHALEEGWGEAVAPLHYSPMIAIPAHVMNRGGGLGLYIAKNILQRHKGILEINTMLEDGVAYRVRLPLMTK